MEAAQIAELSIIYVLGILGGVLNIISCSYFVKYQFSTLSGKLLSLLTITDFAVCLLNITNYSLIAAGVNYNDSLITFTVTVILNIAIGGSGLVTTVLSVVRYLLIANPFRRISSHAVWASLCCISLIYIPVCLYFRFNNQDVAFALVTLFFFFISFVICSVTGGLTCHAINNTQVSPCDLSSHVAESRDQMTSSRVEATRTIVVLVVVYCVVNGIAWTAVLVNFTVSHIPSIMSTVLQYLIMLFWINAVLNPLIYVTRKKKLECYMAQAISEVIHVATFRSNIPRLFEIFT